MISRVFYRSDIKRVSGNGGSGSGNVISDGELRGDRGIGLGVNSHNNNNSNNNNSNNNKQR